MAKQSRVNLKANFQTGFKPTEQNFADLIDSFVSLEDDALTLNNKDLSLEGSITLGNTTSPVAGTLRWNSDTNKFEAYDGTKWTEFGSDDGSSGVGESVWTEAGSGISYDGTVAVGSASSPAYRLEVGLAADSGESQRVKIGNALHSNGYGATAADAFISHRTAHMPQYGAYGIRLETGGSIRLNSGDPGSKISLGSEDKQIVTLQNSNLGVGTSTPPPDFAFSVVGRAAKTSAGGWETFSDKKLKKEIKDFKDGLETIKKIVPRTFKFNGLAGTQNNEENIGIVAQEIEKVCPYTVRKVKTRLKESDTKDAEILSYDGDALIYVAINAIKELSEKIDKLEKKMG